MPGVKGTMEEIEEGSAAKKRKQAGAIAISEQRRHPGTGRFLPHGRTFGMSGSPSGSRPTQ